jgi:hypothetical protein
MADWERIFLVGEHPKGVFTVVEANGKPIPETSDPLMWSIRKGCMILDPVPAEKVYRLRAMAEARAEELRKTEGQA